MAELGEKWEGEGGEGGGGRWGGGGSLKSASGLPRSRNLAKVKVVALNGPDAAFEGLGNTTPRRFHMEPEGTV